MFWIEYILRNGDAHHLNVASRNVPFYVSSGLDILLVAVIFLYLLKRLIIVLVFGNGKRTATSVSRKKKNK